MEELKKIDSSRYAEYEFIVVNIDTEDKNDEMKKIIEDKGIDIKIIFDSNKEIMEQYKPRLIPTTYFIDEKNIIEDIIQGSLFNNLAE